MYITSPKTYIIPCTLLLAQQKQGHELSTHQQCSTVGFRVVKDASVTGGICGSIGDTVVFCGGVKKQATGGIKKGYAANISRAAMCPKTHSSVVSRLSDCPAEKLCLGMPCAATLRPRGSLTSCNACGETHGWDFCSFGRIFISIPVLALPVATRLVSLRVAHRRCSVWVPSKCGLCFHAVKICRFVTARRLEDRL